MAIIKIKNPAIDLDAAEIPNLPASKITSGTFADARIAASNVSQHATSFDDNKIVNDLSTLALRQASNENKAGYNTNSMSVDVFQDSSKITNLTSSFRSDNEYVFCGSGATGGVDSNTILLVDGHDATNPFTDLINGMTGTTNDIPNTGGTPSRNTTSSNHKFTGYNVIDMNGGTISYGTQYTSYWDGTGDFTIEFFMKAANTMSSRERFWCFGNDGTQGQLSYGVDYGSSADFNAFANSNNYDPSGTFNLPATDTDYHHYRYVRSGSSVFYYFDGSKIATQTTGDNTADTYNSKFRISGRPRTGSPQGTEFFDAFYTDFMIHKGAKSTGASYTVPTVKASKETEGGNATGSFEGTTVTASSSVSSMGAIITYQNQAGTNALNTDIVLKLSADNGSNYSTATLTAMPDFSSGIKMAKVNDLSVTAGTQLKYKLEFANQSSSKIARIRGVSLQY